MSSFFDIAFTPSVKAFQERRGSRRSYARMEISGGFRAAVTPDLAAFLAARGSVRPVAFTARQFALYASTLHPGGAVHELLAEYPLG